MFQATFKRYELKYRLSKHEKTRILQEMQPYMALDAYGHTTIRNIYFDTDDFRLVRHSMEKPVYKEKLRIRSYRPAREDTPVFIELKKKYDGVVYKRRLTLPEGCTMKCFRTGSPLPVHSQISEEIEYFRSYYQTLQPVLFLSYEREAYYSLDGSDFRVTFDENILYRDRNLSLGSGIYGTALLGEGEALMEIKTAGGIPLWMTQILTRQHIYQTSFSKYGAAYQDQIIKATQRRKHYA